jgi:hypothetical protein
LRSSMRSRLTLPRWASMSAIGTSGLLSG